MDVEVSSNILAIFCDFCNFVEEYMGSSTEIATIKWYALFSSTE